MPIFVVLNPIYMAAVPAWLRRAVVNVLPLKNVRKMCKIVDIMDKTAGAVLNAKRAALEAGDEELAKQVGEGKDIISILRKLILVFYRSAVTDQEIKSGITCRPVSICAFRMTNW